MKCRIAGSDDYAKLEPLFKANAERLEHNFEKNYKPVCQKILSDMKHGLVFVAEKENEVEGFMMLTYEWSDWRNRVFLWF